MHFNDVSTNLGICQEIDSLCDSDTTSYPVSVKTRRVNTALEDVIGKILGWDGTWQFDDSNYSTLPIGKGDLVSGQYRYTFSDEFLDIESIDILDLNGIYRQITPFDSRVIGRSFEEYFNISTTTTPSGWPSYYDKQGDSIRLSTGPTASDATLTNGLRVHFKRTASLFTASDTTKVPGIASPFHILLAYKTALPYCASYKKDRVAWLAQEIIKIEGDESRGIIGSMQRYYSRRAKDERKVMSMAGISFR